ncbi:hypothetical protein HKX48_000120 [Thoreauomyces humboldtii]|nr:hypothetical protein HKX48_000120 [Thoreauomyces humboldtii]
MDCSSIEASQIKLVISDVDGTLLDSDHTLHKRNEKAIIALRKKHPEIPFVICTGKPFAATLDIRRTLSLEGQCPAVHTNGCLIFDKDGSILKESKISSSLVADIVNLNRPTRTTTFVYCRNEVFQVIDDGKGRNGNSWVDHMRAFGEDVKVGPEGLLERIARGEINVNKMCVLLLEEEAEDTRQRLVESFPGVLDFTQALPYCIEMLPRGAGKALALQGLLETYQITADNVLAFGDGENDEGMLRLAKYGVSMSNAMPRATEAASYRTVSNDEGGVGAVLETIFKL